MSLHVNLSSAALRIAYNKVVKEQGIDWALFTYDAGTNDLKVQSTGDGGLEELEEEFSAGRIQYAFVRVVEPNSKLPKFVQINWCGDGVPEAKKGLFHIHSSAVGRFLSGTHVVISARNESDVAPAVIMKRVEASSGAKYSFQEEAPRKAEPIAPVGGSAYIKKQAPPPPPKPSLPTAPRPTGAGSLYGKKPGGSAIEKEDKKPAPVAAPPWDDDRIPPVGTAYTPVSLPAPKKLKNPFAKAQQPEPVRGSAGGGAPKKLTWSERQTTIAKKECEEEEAPASAAVPPPPPMASRPAFKTAVVGGAAASQYEPEPEPSKPEEEAHKSITSKPQTMTRRQYIRRKFQTGELLNGFPMLYPATERPPVVDTIINGYWTPTYMLCWKLILESDEVWGRYHYSGPEIRSQFALPRWEERGYADQFGFGMLPRLQMVGRFLLILFGVNLSEEYMDLIMRPEVVAAAKYAYDIPDDLPAHHDLKWRRMTR